MKTNHTPGPWKNYGGIIQSGKRAIAKVCPLADPAEDEANAELIASAPDLARQLDEAREQVKVLAQNVVTYAVSVLAQQVREFGETDRNPPSHAQISNDIAQARAALAQAQGGDK